MLEYGKFGYGTAQGNIDVYISISCRGLSYVGPSAVYLFMTSFFAIEKITLAVTMIIVTIVDIPKWTY